MGPIWIRYCISWQNSCFVGALNTKKKLFAHVSFTMTPLWCYISPPCIIINGCPSPLTLDMYKICYYFSLQLLKYLQHQSVRNKKMRKSCIVSLIFVILFQKISTQCYPDEANSQLLCKNVHLANVNSVMKKVKIKN
jgi:hypothetical protein